MAPLPGSPFADISLNSLIREPPKERVSQHTRFEPEEPVFLGAGARSSLGQMR